MTLDAYEIELPARPEVLGTARAFVASVARHLKADEDVIADLKLAISEACTDALEAGRPLRVRASRSAGSLDLEVAAPAEGWSGSPKLEDGERAELVRSLFPGAAFADAGGERVLRFTVAAG